MGLGWVLAMSAAVCLGQNQPAAENLRQNAFALEQQGKLSEAEAAWQTLAKSPSVSAEAYAHLGLLEARQQHYSDAVPLYRKALALDPSFPGLRLNLGLALFKSDEMKAAIEQFSVLLKSAPPGSPEAQRLLVLLGMSHYALREFADAAGYLRQAKANDPHNLTLLLSLAHSCLWSKQYPCVLDTYHEILTLNAESAEADMLAGEALDEMKDAPGAIQQFRAAVKANPHEPDVHFGLGYLLWKQRQYAEAAQEFRAELANNPDHADALLHLADTELQMQHPEAALPMLEKVARTAPDLAMAHLDLGIVYADSGRNDDALRELSTAARLAPGDVNVHWRLGRLYRAMGRKDEAKAEFDKASTLNATADEALFQKMNQGRRRSENTPAQPNQ